MEQLHKLCFSGDVGPHLTCEFIDGDAGGLPIVTLTVRCLATWDCELTTRNGEYHIIVTEPVPLVSDYVATGVVDAGTEDNEPTTLGIEVQMEGQVVESTEYAWFDLEDAPDGPIPTVTTPGPPPDWTAIHEKHCSRADSDCTANEYRELSEAKKAELEAICTAAGKPAGCGNTHVEIYGPDLVQADAEFGRLWSAGRPNGIVTTRNSTASWGSARRSGTASPRSSGSTSTAAAHAATSLSRSLSRSAVAIPVDAGMAESA